MIINLEALTYIRNEVVDGIGPWVWILGETGAWDGPKQDWEKSHKQVLNLVKHKRTVIQAGGNQGMYPRILAEHFHNVYTFEPDALNFYCLSRNCLKDNVYKFQAALGNHNATVDLERRIMGNTGQHTVRENIPGHIPILKLDDLNVRDVDMIWLDVEGYEYKVLLGAVRTIQQFKPLIMAERGGSTDIKNLLTPYGYKEVRRSVSDTVWAV